MMKTTFALLSFSLLCLGNCFSQTSCAEMLAAARKSEQAGQFRDAILKYNAAKVRCGASKAKEIDERVLGVFDKIDGLRTQAQVAERKAKEEASKAEKARVELAEALESVKAEKIKNDRIIRALYFYRGEYGLASTSTFSGLKFGFINKNGEVLIDYLYEDARPFDFQTGFAPVQRNGVLYYLDTSGKEYRAAASLNTITEETVIIDLRNQDLAILPDSLVSFSKIEYLFLNDNKLTALPSKIGQLSNLKVLDAEGNNLKALPESIGQLTQMGNLDLSRNKLEALPKAIGQLRALQFLDLTDNNLQNLPESIGDLAQLKTLSLKSNSLQSAPASMGRLQKLEDIKLNDNKLQSLPITMGNLSSLKKLNLSKNQLSQIPDFAFELENLFEFNLYDNPIYDLPASFEKLPTEALFALGEALDFSCEALEDSIAANIEERLPSPELLSLSIKTRLNFHEVFELLLKRQKEPDWLTEEQELDLYLDLDDLTMSYESLSLQYFLNRNFDLAEKAIYQLIELDEKIDFHEYLPFAILFQGKSEEARQLFVKWKDKPTSRGKLYKGYFIRYFEDFKQMGITPAKVSAEAEAIKQFLQE